LLTIVDDPFFRLLFFIFFIFFCASAPLLLFVVVVSSSLSESAQNRSFVFRPPHQGATTTSLGKRREIEMERTIDFIH